jgi:SAM-dependent methyltransferase
VDRGRRETGDLTDRRSGPFAGPRPGRGLDGGRSIDWGRTSGDYAAHRPGPPPSYFEGLCALGVGRAGDRLLDLATGTGLVARGFAQRGCTVAGIDVASEQVESARAAAEDENLVVDWHVGPVEQLPFGANRFDVATANQCWLYFEAERVIAELDRVLVPGGLIAITHFSYLPRRSAIAHASEQLVLRYNPDWGGADWNERVPLGESWPGRGLRRRALLVYDEPISFTRESWRGRMRALRGIGASLSAAEVEAFDTEHAALLADIAPERFEILHRIDAHVFTLEADQPLS